MHRGQGAENGALARQFTSLAGGLEVLASEMGDAWENTVVVVASEFGRSTSPNSELGTDHGLANAVLVLGGSVKGGKVYGKWPGLASQTKTNARELQPLTDIRSVFKSVLTGHLGLDKSLVERTIFPGSGNAPPLSGLV